MSLKTIRKSLFPQIKTAKLGATSRVHLNSTPSEMNPNLLTVKSYRPLAGSVNSTVSRSQQKLKGAISTRNFKARSVCLIRDAAQSREWLVKAKESILKDLCIFINASNCLFVEQPANACVYKYFIGKGNNGGLIKKCMNSRPWWVLVDENHIMEANFIWSQGKIQEYFDKIPISATKLKTINHDLIGKSISCQEVFSDTTSSPKKIDISELGYNQITLSPYYLSFTENHTSHPILTKLQNKLEHNYHLSDKKFLYKNMKEYYFSIGENVFDYLPLTFHIDNKGGEFSQFLQNAQELPSQLWIVKPGENTNRGTGIFITNKLDAVISEISSVFKGKVSNTYVVQKYIEKPFLINKRKFDIRLYCLCTSVNGVFQAYFYQEGYLRTACKVFNSNDMDKFIHLTNDAVQNKCEDYGRWENGNKLSYSDFQRYLDIKKIGVNFSECVLPKLKKIVQDTVRATWMKMNKDLRMFSFEVFGYDFLLDSNLTPWLLEVNTNPCLELAATNLARIIPEMIENTLKLVIDPLFPEPKQLSKRSSNKLQVLLPENKFELIFHQDSIQ